MNDHKGLRVHKTQLQITILRYVYLPDLGCVLRVLIALIKTIKIGPLKPEHKNRKAKLYILRAR